MQPMSETSATAETVAALDVADERAVTRSWDDAVRIHAGMVYRLAYRLTGNRHDAEDLTHDVFVRVFRYWRTADPARGTLGGWLARITTNLFVDEIRRRQRLRLEPLTTQEDRFVSPEPLPAEFTKSAPSTRMCKLR
jgi:RNA polymerase sigma-70 factor (ECF subfamily)